MNLRLLAVRDRLPPDTLSKIYIPSSEDDDEDQESFESYWRYLTSTSSAIAEAAGLAESGDAIVYGELPPAVCVAFSRHGAYFAVGCEDGTVAIVDFFTGTTARKIRLGQGPVTSISWSAKDSLIFAVSNGGKLLTHIDLSPEKCTIVRSFFFLKDEAVAKVEAHPSRFTTVLLSPSQPGGEVRIFDVESGSRAAVRLPTNDAPEEQASGSSSSSRRLAKDKHCCCACFSRTGGQIVIGSGSCLYFFSVDSISLLSKEDVKWDLRKSRAKVIRGMGLTRDGKHLLVNLSDAKIKLFSLLDGCRGINKDAASMDFRQVDRVGSFATGSSSGFVVQGDRNQSIHTLRFWDRESESCCPYARRGGCLLAAAQATYVPLIGTPMLTTSSPLPVMVRSAYGRSISDKTGRYICPTLSK